MMNLARRFRRATRGRQGEGPVFCQREDVGIAEAARKANQAYLDSLREARMAKRATREAERLEFESQLMPSAQQL